MFNFTFLENTLTGPLIDRPDTKSSQTALHVASKRKCKEIVEMLLDNDANATALTVGKKTILHSLLGGDLDAIVDDEECLEIIKMAIEKGTVLTSPDEKGKTLLHLAAKKKLKNVLTFLIPQFNCDEVTADGNTALHLLFSALTKEEENDFVDVISTIIDKNSNILFVCNNQGRTPLHIASKNKLIEILKFLTPFYQL